MLGRLPPWLEEEDARHRRREWYCESVKGQGEKSNVQSLKSKGGRQKEERRMQKAEKDYETTDH